MFVSGFPGEAPASSGPLQSLLHYICWDAFDIPGQPSKWLRDSRFVCARLAATAVHSESRKRQREEGKIQKKSRKMIKSLEGGLQKLWMTYERQAFEREKDEAESRKETNGTGNRAAEVESASGRSAFHHFLKLKL